MYSEFLLRLKQEGLYREIRDRGSGQGRIIKIGKRDLLNFCSNDYLGLAADADIIRKSLDMISKYGVGSGASRLVAGGSECHQELERAIAEFKATEKALLFNSGYAANTGAIPALTMENCTIFSDELNHASIVDGIRLARAGRIVYPHKDMDALKEALKKAETRFKMVITDTLFSMDGDLAPIEEIYTLCREEGALLYLDDAHGTGVLGKGRGAMAHFGLAADGSVIQMGTLSKAVGSFGAFIAGSGEIVDFLVNTARSLIFSTALPSVLAAAALEVFRKLTADSERVDKLWSNVQRMHLGLDQMGIDKGMSTTQIIPLLCPDINSAVELSRFLADDGIHAPAIRPPSVRVPRVRLSICAFHLPSDIDRILAVLKECYGRIWR